MNFIDKWFDVEILWNWFRDLENICFFVVWKLFLCMISMYVCVFVDKCCVVLIVSGFLLLKMLLLIKI